MLSGVHCSIWMVTPHSMLTMTTRSTITPWTRWGAAGTRRSPRHWYRGWWRSSTDRECLSLLSSNNCDMLKWWINLLYFISKYNIKDSKCNHLFNKGVSKVKDKMFEVICLVFIYIIILFICIQHSLVVVVSLTLFLIFKHINDGNNDNTELLCEVKDLKKKVEQLGS